MLVYLRGTPTWRLMAGKLGGALTRKTEGSGEIRNHISTVFFMCVCVKIAEKKDIFMKMTTLDKIRVTYLLQHRVSRDVLEVIRQNHLKVTNPKR